MGRRNRLRRRSVVVILLTIASCLLVFCSSVPEMLDEVLLQVVANDRSSCLSTAAHFLEINNNSAPFLLDLTVSPYTRLIAHRLHLVCGRALLPSLPVEASREISKVRQEQLDCFASRLDSERRLRLRSHLRALKQALEAADAEYYLDMGSALGAWRHFGFIPYDEDIDVRINARDKERVATQLARLSDHPDSRLLYHNTEWLTGHWKVYATDVKSEDGGTRPFAFDVFFYEREPSTVAVAEPPYTFNASDVFPLRLRPFEGLLWPTPNHVERVLKGYFPTSKPGQCLYYSHANVSAAVDKVKAKLCQFQAIPCLALAKRFAFVHRIEEKGFGALEFLMKDSRVLQVAFLPRFDERSMPKDEASFFQSSSEDWKCEGTSECVEANIQSMEEDDDDV